MLRAGASQRRLSDQASWARRERAGFVVQIPIELSHRPVDKGRIHEHTAIILERVIHQTENNPQVCCICVPIEHHENPYLGIQWIFCQRIRVEQPIKRQHSGDEAQGHMKLRGTVGQTHDITRGSGHVEH